MISVEKARSGHPILRKNGRLLCSAYDPVKEAHGWASSELSRLNGDITVVILGLGLGYHVRALCDLNPAITPVVIESDHSVEAKYFELQHWSEESSPNLVRDGFPHTFEIVVQPQWRLLFANERLLDALSGPFSILKHGPSCQIDSSYYSAVERLLVGRGKEEFLLHLRVRSELHSLLEPRALQELNDEPISIKTLQRLFSFRAPCTRERRLWRVLEELVK